MSDPGICKDFVYRFLYDGGFCRLTYGEYMKSAVLRKWINDEGRNRLCLGRTIYTFSSAFLAGHPQVAETLELLDRQNRENPLQFFAPTTPEMLAFLNDDDADVQAVIDANRAGKTTAATVKWLVSDPPAFVCDPTWPVFSEHGVRWREYRGPVALAAASYKEKNLKLTIWPVMVQHWVPDEFLGVYGKTWKGRGAKPSPAWGHDPSARLTNGTTIDFYTYQQDQDNFEGGVYKRWLWDEQGKEHLFDGADERTRTVKGRHIFSLTPHRVDGRPDTGAGSWIEEMLSGRKPKGHRVRVYGQTGIMVVPDWIYPESEKSKAIDKWERQPAAMGDVKTLAEGRARLYGEWHRASGLVLDEWNPEVHWIDPLWKRPPVDHSVYRGIDHGQRNPTACLSFSVDKAGNIFVYREYYERGRTIFQDAKAIVEAAGNEWALVGKEDAMGVVFRRYEERYREEWVLKQVMDSRSFSLPDGGGSGKTIGWLYRCAGLRVNKASGRFSDHWVPMVQALLHIDPTRKHVVTGAMGAPRLYVFNCCVNFKREIEHYVWEEQRAGDGKDPTEKPRKKDDHLISALQYAAQIPLRYVGNPLRPASVLVGGGDGRGDFSCRRGVNQSILRGEDAGGYRRV